MESPNPVQNRVTRTVLDYDKLAELSQGLKAVGHRLVVTIGTYDLIHIGHSRYLEQARALGDILIVGVDSDRAVKIYKKDDSRPMVPESERTEMLLHTRHVDYVTLIDDVDEQGSWQHDLLEAVRPQVFVAVEDSYSEPQLECISGYCEDLVVLPRQASTSTSEQIRRTLITHTKPLADQLRQLADRAEAGDL